VPGSDWVNIVLPGCETDWKASPSASSATLPSELSVQRQFFCGWLVTFRLFLTLLKRFVQKAACRGMP
jgi:hypothetical protein